MAVIHNIALRRNVSFKLCKVCGIVLNQGEKVHPECSARRKHEQKYEALVLETYPMKNPKADTYYEKHLAPKKK